MLSYPRNHLRKFVASLKWQHLSSFKGRLTVLSAGLSVTVIWALVFFSTTIQRQEFSAVLFDQQLASTKYIAADLDGKLSQRMSVLAVSAAKLADDLDPKALNARLQSEVILHRVFTAGIAVIGLNGMAVADFPELPGRRGAYFGDRDYFRKVVEEKRPYIGQPITGRTLKRLVLPIAVPVFGREGNIRGVMVGVTDLTAPNFLGQIVDPATAGKGMFYVISLRDKLVVAATEAKHILASVPRRGENLMYDRFVDGFEESGLASDAENGLMLYSAKRVPSANWLVMAALPAETAFQPVATMRDYLVTMAILLTLLVIFLAHWVTRRIFVPLDATGLAMRQMTQGAAPLAPLPFKARDEIGGMIDNVNALIEGRRRSDAALASNEERLRALAENASDAMIVHANGSFVYVNASALRLFGASDRGQLLGRSVLEMVHPDVHDIVRVRMRSVSEDRESAPPVELKLLQVDGSIVFAEVSAVPYFYANENASLVFARNITERKHAEIALRKSEERFHRLVALSSEWYWETDENFRLTRIAGWQDKTGVRIPDNVIGNTPEGMGILGDEAVWKARHAILSARIPFRDMEYAWKEPEGKIVWHSISGEPMFDEIGAFKGYRGTGKDITERKRAERALRQSQARIRELVDHQEQIKEEERKRIARDVHDELGQMLLVMRIDALILVEHTSESQPMLHRKLSLMLRHIDTAIKSVKAIINDLRPSVLDLGLMPAMEWQIKDFQRRSGIECVLDVDNEDFDRYLDEKRRVALFRIMQESLSNILQHARASKVRIAVRIREDRLEIVIADNGVGITAGSRGKRGSFGLVGIEERVAALGGAFTIDSNPGKGTRLNLFVSLGAHHELAL